jgi:hypothetical protein
MSTECICVVCVYIRTQNDFSPHATVTDWFITGSCVIKADLLA